MSRTALLIHPTIEEVTREAQKIDLPDTEAKKFWLFYDSKGWKVGKSPMVSWLSALAGWRIRWMERTGHHSGNPPLQARMF
jgi:hypothetical protein